MALDLSPIVTNFSGPARLLVTIVTIMGMHITVKPPACAIHHAGMRSRSVRHPERLLKPASA
jgi:hypothetical protein